MEKKIMNNRGENQKKKGACGAGSRKRVEPFELN